MLLCKSISFTSKREMNVDYAHCSTHCGPTSTLSTWPFERRLLFFYDFSVSPWIFIQINNFFTGGRSADPWVTCPTDPLHHGALTKNKISKSTHWKGALRLFGTPEHDDNCRLTIPFLMRFTHGWLIRSVPSYPLPLRKKNRKSHHMSAYTNHARKEFRKEPSHFRLGWYIQPWILDLLTFFTIFFHLF